MSVDAPVPDRELSDTAYARFRKALLREKGSGHQRDFLRKVRDTAAFLDHVSSIETAGTVAAALVPEPMTESEYKDPPVDTEQALYTAWKGLTPAVACRSTFWAQLTIEHIRAGRIQSAYLAANGGNLPGGAERIDMVLSRAQGLDPKKIDSCVRTVLRRLGGLREVRGNRSVYVDCPLARAWWRERFVNQAAGDDTGTASLVRTVLRTSQTYWEKLIDRVVFRNSTFGSNTIRGAFLRMLAVHVRETSNASLLVPRELQRLTRRTTVQQGTRELSILRESELDDVMRDVITPSAV